MIRTLLALGLLIATLSSAWANAERQTSSYPFRVERSASTRSQISGATGDVIYRETSRGRDAAFLATPMPAGKWPIDLGPGDPLFPIEFGGKNITSVFYCPDKFTLAYKAPHQTVCFADRDKDGRLEQAAIGERDAGFVFEITGRYLESAPEAIEGSRAVSIGTPRAITPAPYSIQQVRPTPGEEGIVELRYAGLQMGLPAFDISLRATASKTIVHSERRLGRRGDHSMRIALPHPLIAYWTKRSPQRLTDLSDAVRPTSMVIRITKADSEQVSATIERPFAAWSWYRQNCDDDAPQLVHVESGNLPLLVRRGEIGLCEKASWVQRDRWWIAGVQNAASGPLNRQTPRR